MKPVHFLGTALAVCAAFVAGGCGDLRKGKSGDPPPVVNISGPAPASTINENEAQAFALAYINVFGKTNASPKAVEDLDAWKDDFKDVLARIKDGSFVVIWNAALTQDVNKNEQLIIAHEKNAPERGGLVIFGGGTVDVVSADEFKKQTVASPAK